ncbi:MAG: hypothetical protein NZ772_14585 [Cyanobacteria bacterium]|nr:hypothetical protein [Cyanobacteriota bacterium]
MGLAERRAVKAFQDNKLPALKQEIDAAAGFEVNLEVNWDAIAKEDQAHMYEEAFLKVYFKPLIEALKAICIDDLGKEALRDGLKKVVITDNNKQEVTFQFGTLTISFYSIYNLDGWADRKAEIQTVLEKGL